MGQQQSCAAGGGVDAALQARSNGPGMPPSLAPPSTAPPAPSWPAPAPATHSALLSCFERGLWASGSSLLLNDRFVWDLLTRASVWDCGAADSVSDGNSSSPGAPAPSHGSSNDPAAGSGRGDGASSLLLGNRLVDLLSALDAVAQAGQGASAAVGRAHLLSDFLAAYHTYCRGDDVGRNVDAVPRHGESLHETMLTARQALLRSVHAAVATSRASSAAPLSAGRQRRVAASAADKGSAAGPAPTTTAVTKFTNVPQPSTLPPHIRFIVESAVEAVFSQIQYVYP